MKIDLVYIVRDPTPVSELSDICYECAVHNLQYWIRGSQEIKPAEWWEREHVTLYTSKAEAMADAKERLKNRPPCEN